MPRQLTPEEESAIENALVAQAPAGLSDEAFDRWFIPRRDGAIAEAQNSNAPVSGSALRRFVANGARMLNPVTMVTGAAHAVMNPGDTLNGMVDAASNEFTTAKNRWNEGRVSEAIGHGAAGLLPVIGPAAAAIGEQSNAGDVAGAAGAMTGMLLPVAAGAVAKGRVASQARAGMPAVLEQQAVDQVAQRVLAPGNVRFKGRAQDIAPEMLRRGMTGGREDLAIAADEGATRAGQAIDDAVAAGGGPKAGVLVDPIVAQLQRRIDDLSINGEPIKGAEGRVAGLRARISQIERTAKTSQRPGLVRAGQAPPSPMRALSFEDLRKYRDEQYRLADEARGYERAGNVAMSDEGFAARETGSAIRSEFARLSPDLADANADYTFFKTLGDVLDPAQGRPKVTGPSSGITGGAATSGAVAGHLIGPKAAFVMSVVRPWIQKVRAEPAWQLADAQTKMRLAEAIRNGDIPTAQTLMVRIAGAKTMTTSPTESQRRTTAPAWSTP